MTYGQGTPEDWIERHVYAKHSVLGIAAMMVIDVALFGFIGIKNPEFISADGIQVGPEHREKAVAGALKAAGDLNAA